MSALFRKKRKVTDTREPGAGPLERTRVQHETLKDTESPGPIASSSDSLIHVENNLGLNTVYEPSGSTRIIADIVFVHGLTGSAGDTWRDKRTGLYWPTDLLSKDQTNVRIITFGYDANVVRFWTAASQNRVANNAMNMLGGLAHLRRKSPQRDIIFIVHSMGGLVAQNALSLSRSSAEPHIQQIEKSATAVAFLGTPHHGSDLAAWGVLGSLFANIARPANTDIVAVLKPGSEVLAIIQDNFHSLLRRRKTENDEIAITCFYEELPVQHVGEIVPKHSAIIPGYSHYGIHADHMGMTKFSSSNDNGYKAVLGEVERWLDNVTQRMGRSQAAHISVNLVDKRQDEPEPRLSENELNCLQSLYTSDYESHRKRNPDRVPGTCEWFFRHPKYQHWREERTSSLLWISADPGCGKSVLAASLIEELQNREAQSALPGTVCFFFFKDDNEKQNNAIPALCALLHQLFIKNNPLIKHAMSEFEKKNLKFIEEFGSLWNILTSVAADKGSGNVICIIDGLDECEESTRTLLIRSLVSFYSEIGNQNIMGPLLKVLVTSRPYLSIEREFYDLPSIRLRAEDETDLTSGDIELVVKAKVKMFGERRYLSSEVQGALVEHLISNADRTFLWVSLVLADLEKSPRASKRVLTDILKNIPGTLDAFYDKILNESINPKDVTKLLQIVVAAARPLSLREMSVAFVIKSSDQSYEDLDLEPSIGNAIRDLCGLFVKVIDGKVYLVHQTAKEFLVNDTMTTVPSPGSWRHSLCLAQSNLVLAEICISYLLFSVFENDPLVVRGKWDTLLFRVIIHAYTQKHDFLVYAAEHWADHFREAKIQEEATLLKSALDVCDTQSKRFLTWFQVHWVSVGPYNCHCPQGFTGLTVGSYFGLGVMVKLLLDKGVDPNSEKDAYGRTPLSWAAQRGHEAAVGLLLNKGADPDLKDNDGLPPLSWAAWAGQEAVVRLLLDTGVVDGQAPLVGALQRSQNAVVKLLRSYNANPTIASTIVERQEPAFDFDVREDSDSS